MKLYLAGNEHEVALHKILTQALYDKVSPVLESLGNSKGARSAFETMLQQRMLQDEYFVGLAGKLKEGDKLDHNKLQKDFRFQELVGECIIKVKTNLFEFINVDAETIPLVFSLAKVCIDTTKIDNVELSNGIDSDVNSEFWAQQDIDGILETLTFFRSSVLRRIRVGI